MAAVSIVEAMSAFAGGLRAPLEAVGLAVEEASSNEASLAQCAAVPVDVVVPTVAPVGAHSF
jgi:hypothetical protein